MILNCTIPGILLSEIKNIGNSIYHALLYFLSLGGNQREKTSTNDRSGFELQKVVPRKMTQEIKQVYPDVYQVLMMITWA